MKRLLIVGCGDVALRTLPVLAGRYRVYALSHSRERFAQLRARGVVPMLGDLDCPDTLDELAGLAQEVLHFAPPPPQGTRDTRTAHLLAALAKAKSLPQHLVYISTTGVYGNCAGALVAETMRLRPQTDRALRRVDAERQLREWGRRNRVRVSILRAPGIYAENRLPLARLKAGTPVLNADEDCYTGHVHADDLACMAVQALRFAPPGRLYNAADDSRLKMGEWFDLVADRCGLPRPARISRDDARIRIPANLLSFMAESRRLSNRRIKNELRLKLRYPTVAEGLEAALRGGLSITAATACN